LTLFTKLYDAEGTPALQARLPALHAELLIKVLEKFAQRIRIDCVSVANHNLIRLLDEPGNTCEA